MRTQAQILRDCEQRFAEIRAEKERWDNDPLIQYPCKTCRHYEDSSGYVMRAKYCTQPLVVGFDGKQKIDGRFSWDIPKLCGPEKALWEPMGRRDKFRAWFKRNDEWAVPVSIVFGVPALIIGLPFLVLWLT